VKKEKTEKKEKIQEVLYRYPHAAKPPECATVMRRYL